MTGRATGGPVDRWRLVLGRYAASRLGDPADGSQLQRLTVAMDFLYDREYAGRGARGDAPGQGSLDESAPALVGWLTEVRELFPQEACEIVERHALERYELNGLVTDPEVLRRLEPNQALLRTLLTLKGHLTPAVLDIARQVIAQVVEELRRRLEADIRPALTGRRHQHRHSPIPVPSAFDVRDTVRRNLAHWDPDRRQLVLQELRFFQRNDRRIPWDIVLCVDQSGSMAGSVIHSAVMAGILAALGSFRVRLVVFDTSVVDLSSQVDDPVEVLMSVQLGGGTDIASALRYCRTLVEDPQRTVLVLITDFEEGGSVRDLVAQVQALAESRVRMIGLASLDRSGSPSYDRKVAATLADRGMEIAALTPRELTAWLVEVTS